MRIELINGACLPEKKHLTDAGYDLRSNYGSDIVLKYRDELKIPTGVKFAIPLGYMGLVVPRSGLGGQGLVMKNTIGIIDSDYRGEVFVKVKNTDEIPIVIKQFSRFAQIIVVPVFLDTLIVVDSLDETARGEGGFGKSGVE